jgi:endonuclease G
MKRLIIVALLLLLVNVSTFAKPQAVPYPIQMCSIQAPFGLPYVNAANTTTICRTAYVLQHDNVAKIPMWVSFVVTPEHAVGCIPRSNAFGHDSSLPEGSRAETSDYAKSGYDTGHIANDNLMSWELNVERESFILSNMCPQSACFNRGVWKVLESAIMSWVVGRNHSMLVYAGPIYNVITDDKIGSNNVDVPTGFYKIVVDLDTHETLAFLFAHDCAPNGKLSTFQTTVSNVELKTGIIFPLPSAAIMSPAVWAYSMKDTINAKRAVCVK